MPRRLLLVPFLLAACGGGAGAAGGLGAGVGAIPDPTGRADYLLDLGAAVVGGERRGVFVVENGGASSLEVTVGPVALPFALEGEPARTVPAGSRVELFFAFHPSAEGPAETIVDLGSNGGSYRIRLVGTGARAGLGCTPQGVDFGRPAPGETRRRTVTCENSGPVEEPIAIGKIHGATAAAFRWNLPENGTERTLAPGESLPIDIDFTPPAAGEYAAEFEVDRAGGGGRIASILLIGIAE
jgi:hypothetical protein